MLIFVNIPIIYFTQKEITLESIVQDKRDISGNVLNELVHSDLWIARMHEMRHQAFASLFQRSPSIFSDWYSAQETPQIVSTSYSWVARYVLEFVNAYLKHDLAAIDFLRNSVTKNGVPPNIMDVEYHQRTGIPATVDGLAVAVGSRGFDQAGEVYAEQRALNPDYKIDESRLAGWAADLVEKNHIKEAIDVFKLTLSIYPDSWMAYDGLGEAYENSGDIDSAVKSYKHSVEKNPKDDYAKTQLKKLVK
jgi:hypothetical protein